MANLPLTRDEAINWLKSLPNSEPDFNHYLETEAIMRALAKHFNENEIYWSLLGLLHDIDWALTKNNVEQHCVLAEQMLTDKKFPQQFIDDLQSHCYNNDLVPQFKDKKRITKIQFCLTAAEILTGLIYAYALMRGRNITTMEVKGLKKKFKDKAFAANCNRDLSKEIELTGLNLDAFLELAINAIKEIKGEIGLE